MCKYIYIHIHIYIYVFFLVLMPHRCLLPLRPPYQGLTLLFADLDRLEYSREVDNYVAWQVMG